MCGGVYYQTPDGELIRQYFPNPKAVLPVKKKDGSMALLPWGRRKEQAGELPQGGWARQDSIYAGKWDRFFPQPVKIQVVAFMEKNYMGESKWMDLVPPNVIQGLLALDRQTNMLRVYIVTIDPDLSDQNEFSRWPKTVVG